MKEVSLKPCPFCGGKPVLLKHNDEDYYKVFCECCGARQWTFANRTDRDAIRNWNTRKPIDNIVAELEENYDCDSQKETEDLDLKSDLSSLKTEKIAHLSLKRWWDGMEVTCIHGSSKHEVWLCVCKEGRFYLDGSQNYKVVEWNYPAIVPTQEQIEEAKNIIEQKKYGRNKKYEFIEKLIERLEEETGIELRSK